MDNNNIHLLRVIVEQKFLRGLLHSWSKLIIFHFHPLPLHPSVPPSITGKPNHYGPHIAGSLGSLIKVQEEKGWDIFFPLTSYSVSRCISPLIFSLVILWFIIINICFSPLFLAQSFQNLWDFLSDKSDRAIFCYSQQALQSHLTLCYWDGFWKVPW